MIVSRQRAASDLLAPVRQQPATDVMPPGNVGDDRAWRLGFRHDP